MLRGQLAEERERFEREIAAQRFVIEDLQLSLTLQRANLRSRTSCLRLRSRSGPEWEGGDQEEGGAFQGCLCSGSTGID